jgi:hypothetical protein
MADPSTTRDRIAQIDAILADGVRVSRQADRSTEWDLDALRKEREELQRQLAGASGSRFRRVVFSG